MTDVYFMWKKVIKNYNKYKINKRRQHCSGPNSDSVQLTPQRCVLVFKADGPSGSASAVAAEVPGQ